MTYSLVLRGNLGEVGKKIKKKRKSISTNKGCRIIPAPEAQSLSVPVMLVSIGSSCKGRRWSLSASNSCNFLHASKEASCFAKCALILGGPTILWSTAFGGKVKIHSYKPSSTCTWKAGCGMKNLKKLQI